MAPVTGHCAALALALAAWCGPATAREVYRCVREGTVSLSTAPEPGSRCEAKTVADDGGALPNLWGNFGSFSGTLYEREQDGVLVYGTRQLPGSRPYLKFSVETPPGEAAHPGLGRVGRARLSPHSAAFRKAASRRGVEEAWLRAIAHAESDFDPSAVSPKGALGVMQLMPDVVLQYGVRDPLSAAESIDAGARHLRMLLTRYRGDQRLAAAAYNAGVGAVARHGGVPPYRETLEYIEKVGALRERYRLALGIRPERPAP